MNRKHILLIIILLIVTNSLTAAVFVNKTVKVAPAASARREVPSPEIQNIVTQLTSKAEIWVTLKRADKVAATEMMIKLFQDRENVAILKSPEFYVNKVDSIIATNPPMITLTLPTILKISAVMEYDFYNGQDKDELAKQVLGATLYEQNKVRLGR